MEPYLYWQCPECKIDFTAWRVDGEPELKLERKIEFHEMRVHDIQPVRTGYWLLEGLAIRLNG